MGYKVEELPVPVMCPRDGGSADEAVGHLSSLTAEVRAADRDLADWLRVELGLAKLSGMLQQASRLDTDGFVGALRAALPRRQTLSPARLRQARDAFADTAEPARAARIAVVGHERALSAIVNRAYGLTPEDIALMWRTAPPRMPVASPPPEPFAATDSPIGEE